MKLPLVVNAALGVSRPLSSAACRFGMRGADPHLLWLPSRPQPANNAASVSPLNEQWHKDTLMYSPALFFPLLFFLEYRLMRTDGRKMLMYLWLAKALPRSGGVRPCRRRTGTPAPRGEVKSALVRALPASLRTFLFQIRGWLREQAAEIGEELHETQFMTWSLVCLFERRMERRNRSAMTQQCALHTPPATARLPKLAGKPPLPAEALSPGRSTDAAAALAPLGNHTLESLWAHWRFLSPHGITSLIFKEARCFTILTSDCRMRQWMISSADVYSCH